MLLQELPEDVLVVVFGFLTVPSLLRLSICSTFLNKFTKGHSEAIYRRVIIEQGYWKRCSAGDSGFIQRPASTSNFLQQCILAQQSGMNAYGECDTLAWFACNRWVTDHNWATGHFTKTLHIPFQDVWRFKVDSTLHVFVGTRESPQIWTRPTYKLPRPGEIFSTIDAPNFTHVELSEGFCVFPSADRLEVYQLCPPGGQLRYHDRIRPPHHVLALKLRYPHLVTTGVSHGRNTLALHDVRTSELLFDIAAPGLEQINYIDHDSQNIFLAAANEAVQICSKSDGLLVGCLPVCWPRNKQLHAGYPTAVHHHEEGNLFFAVRHSRFFVSNAYRQSMVSQEAHHQHCIWGQFGLWGSISEISVENGRIAACVQLTVEGVDDYVTCLMLIDVPSEEHSLLVTPPKIRILLPSIPTTRVSRIEMDSTCIYLTANLADRPVDANLIHERAVIDSQEYMHGCWEDDDGRLVGPMDIRFPDLDPSHHSVGTVADLSNIQANPVSNNGILAIRFAPL